MSYDLLKLIELLNEKIKEFLYVSLFCKFLVVLPVFENVINEYRITVQVLVHKTIKIRIKPDL